MDPAEPSVLAALASLYRQRRSGRTGQAARDLLVDYEDLLGKAAATTGEARRCAEKDLAEAEAASVLVIERHRLGLPLRIRFSAQNESALFARLGLTTPTSQRDALAALFTDAAHFAVPPRWHENWQQFCITLADAARSGATIKPFSRDAPAEIREILALLPPLLAWETESLRRFASCRLCGNSKRLDALSAKLSACLSRITDAGISSLADLGILENERFLLLHGPLHLVFADRHLDLGLLSVPCRIDKRDLLRATIQTSASRVILVENPAMLQELAKRQSGILLVGSGSEGGFAHSAAITFLQALPAGVEVLHFGDSDPQGFEILRDLRERSGRTITSLGMSFDPSVSGPQLTPADHQLIGRLLVSPFLTSAEKQELSAMREAGHKGLYEQEGRALPSFAGR